jgi:serine phosphatase RsbU (regulator of sigma subunit)
MNIFTIFQTIKAKLLFSFVLFLAIVGFLALTDFWFDLREKRLANILGTLQNIELNLQTAEKDEYVFFQDETINPRFHKTGKSEVLDRRYKLIAQIKADLKALEDFQEIRTPEVIQQTEKAIQALDDYEKNFTDIIALTRKRGFKDDGLEGDMRDYIHEIENTTASYDMSKLLMIRRHEKDFMLRKDTSYTTKLSQAVKQLANEIKNNKPLLDLLIKYEKTFREIAETEAKIGFSENEGIKGKIKSAEKEIEQNLVLINESINQQVNTLRSQNNWIQLVIIFLGSVLIIVLGFLIIRILSKPISRLSYSIHKVVESNFAEEVQISKINTKDELGLLSEDVEYMIAKVKESIREIREKSYKVEHKHRILMESVNYAQRIQQAVLPKHEIDQYFKKYFMLYRPQYDVSGDFYWFMKTREKYFVAVVDCTGKGVSGAFMSLIGNTLLNKVIGEQGIDDPSLILETLNTEFRIALHQNQNLGSDSMDICLCCFEEPLEGENKWNITFAGANRPLIYSKGWEINELKGSPRSIGGRDIQKQITFENQTIKLKKGDALYLTTDGLMNQPNTQLEEYGISRFKEFLRGMIHLPVKEQLECLNTELDIHLDGAVQKDDITVFALKF